MKKVIVAVLHEYIMYVRRILIVEGFRAHIENQSKVVKHYSGGFSDSNLLKAQDDETLREILSLRRKDVVTLSAETKLPFIHRILFPKACKLYLKFKPIALEVTKVSLEDDDVTEA